MSLDTALDEAASRLRDEPVAPPPPFEQIRGRRSSQRRRQRLALTATAVVLVLLGVVAVVRSGSENGLQVVTDDTDLDPAVPVQAGPGLDVLGGGAFRLVAKPGTLTGIEEQTGDAVDVTVLDASLSRVSSLTAGDAAGNRYRVESFEPDPTVTGPWRRNELGGRPTFAIGPRRLAAVERDGTSGSLTWAYDGHRVVRITMTPAGGAEPSDDQLARVAGSVLAADRLPRPDGSPPTVPVPSVLGLGYLEAEQMLLDAGYTVRVDTQITAGAPDGPSPVLEVAPTEADPGVLLITIRISPTGLARMFDADGLPLAPGLTEFVPVGGRDSAVRFIHGRDNQPFPIGGDGFDPGGGVFPTIVMLPDGELAGTWDRGFVPLDVLLDPTSTPEDIDPLLRTTPTTEQRYRDGEPLDGAPYDPPAGWIPVELGGVRFAVPPSWTVVEGASAPCPVGPETVVVGELVGCGLPSVDEAWISIRPVPVDLAGLGDFAEACSASSINGAPACRRVGGTEQLLFDGTNAFLDISTGTGPGSSTVGQITNTLRVSGTAPSSVEPLDVARAWVEALAAGDCAAQVDLASDDLLAGRTPEKYLGECEVAAMPGPITINSLHIPSMAQGRAQAVIEATAADGTPVTYELLLTNDFDPVTRSTGWKVLTSDPA